jgi:two-component system, chemotaxis family, CheB/CheR fusion protein
VKKPSQRGKKKELRRPAKAPAKSSASERNGAPFFVVGIGASAGGLEALGSFFDAMPNDSGMAFVVIQHLSPDHKSMMATLLSRKTRMPVSEAEDGVTVRPNHVYLIPPRKCLTIFDGNLLLTEWNSQKGVNLPIDHFLTSLADDRAERAIAIALSGTGSDGTRGIRSIKEAGGLVMIQDEHSAKFSGMPHSAIATGLADYILPAEKMAQALIKFIRHPLLAPILDTRPRPAASTMQKIESLVRAQTGIDFSGYKQSTLVRRLERRIGISQVKNSEQYLEYLRQTPQEIAAFSKDLLISVTRFFRDRDAFKALGGEIVPAIFANAAKARIIRIWVPGCATGEEAYSVAILLQEHAATLDEKYDIEIFSTDVNKETVAFAGTGTYPMSIAADVPADLLARYFVKTERGYRISRSIRDQVVFAPHNILKDPPFTRMDLVSCRNLLIYLQGPAQRKVLSLFHFALRPQGYLFLGPSETVGEHQNAFEPVNAKARIFQKQDGATIATSEMIPAGAIFAPVPEPPPRSVSSWNGRQRTQEKLREAIHAKLISQFAPTCFAVNEQDEILYSFGQPQAFIALGTGQANLNLLKLAPRDLSLAIATALRKTRKENAVVRYRGVKVQRDQAISLVDLKAEPMSLRTGAPAVTLIFLEEAEGLPPPPASEGEEFDQSKRSTERIGELEEDIQSLREDLQTAVEQRETSAEELQSANEELIASNEELQSGNEELESINEELTTLNSEYLLKNDELLVANNDIDNFLRTSQIGTIFLDESLRIRRFTPLVAAEMNLLPQDTGRGLRDLSHPLIEDLSREANRVLRDGAPVEKTIETRPGVWYLLRISPYQREGASDLGVVVTFVNVSVLKQRPPKNRKRE